MEKKRYICCLLAAFAGLFCMMGTASAQDGTITDKGIPGISIGSPLMSVIPTVNATNFLDRENVSTKTGIVFDRVELVKYSEDDVDKCNLVLYKGNLLIASAKLNNTRDSVSEITVYSPTLALSNGAKVGSDASYLAGKLDASIIQETTSKGKVLMFQMPNIPENIIVYGNGKGTNSQVIAIKVTRK